MPLCAGGVRRRRAGVLMHLTCLPAALGRGGRAFIDWLALAGFRVWQFLPLGPTGPDGSPYWVRSDSAGNPALLDPQELPAARGAEFDAFIEREADWLEDYACFEVLSALEAGTPWWRWPAPYREREPAALQGLRREHARAFAAVTARQFAFHWQLAHLRDYAHARGVELFGDLPFYVAPDSAETWCQRAQFQLDAHGQPLALAGVPPDYFSPAGQLWGNPLYDWNAMRHDGFAFWRGRVRRQLLKFDLLRLDHFRALAAHWAVPAGAPDARGGSWKRTPGRALLAMLREELGPLPIVAEDLGVITPDVDDLRREFALPGMRVLQFAFDGSGVNPHLPHMHERDSTVYTGTHDNDTTLGWYRGLTEAERERVDAFLGAPNCGMPAALMRTALASVGTLAVLPVQDLLALGSEARFNTPATVQGNWRWQLPPEALTPALAARELELLRLYGRA